MEAQIQTFLWASEMIGGAGEESTAVNEHLCTADTHGFLDKIGFLRLESGLEQH